MKGIHGKIIDRKFFITLEKNIKEIQDKDIVHLDLRNLGNIIMEKDGYPIEKLIRKIKKTVS